MTIDEIRDNFALLEDWDDRYRYVIELGRTLRPMPEAEHSQGNKVQGCASQVWLSKQVDRDGREPVLNYLGDSDAHIVRGLIAILLTLYSGHTPREILGTDAPAVFDELCRATAGAVAGAALMTDDTTVTTLAGLFATAARTTAKAVASFSFFAAFLTSSAALLARSATGAPVMALLSVVTSFSVRARAGETARHINPASKVPRTIRLFFINSELVQDVQFIELLLFAGLSLSQALSESNHLSPFCIGRYRPIITYFLVDYAER